MVNFSARKSNAASNHSEIKVVVTVPKSKLFKFYKLKIYTHVTGAANKFIQVYKNIPFWGLHIKIF